jgi:hypothetical protein
MAMNLTDIDQQVNGNIAEPTNDLAARVAEALKPDLEGQLATARAEIEQLKADRAAQDDAILAARLQAAASDANKPLKPVNSGMQDLAYERAVRAAGGLAKFNQLANGTKCELLGIADSEQVKDSELCKYFGAKSSGAAAAQLQRNSPNLYARYRAIFKTRNLK